MKTSFSSCLVPCGVSPSSWLPPPGRVPSGRAVPTPQRRRLVLVRILAEGPTSRPGWAMPRSRHPPAAADSPGPGRGRPGAVWKPGASLIVSSLIVSPLKRGRGRRLSHRTGAHRSPPRDLPAGLLAGDRVVGQGGGCRGCGSPPCFSLCSCLGNGLRNQAVPPRPPVAPADPPGPDVVVPLPERRPVAAVAEGTRSREEAGGRWAPGGLLLRLLQERKRW